MMHLFGIVPKRRELKLGNNGRMSHSKAVEIPNSPPSLKQQQIANWAVTQGYHGFNSTAVKIGAQPQFPSVKQGSEFLLF